MTTLFAGTRGLLPVLGFLLAGGAVAQPAGPGRAYPVNPPPGRVGGGLQAGPLSGFSLKAYASGEAPSSRFDAAVLTGSFNLQGTAHFQTMALDELPLPQSPLTPYVGPGLSFGVDDGKLELGLAAAAGVRFFKSSFEVYLEVTPRIIFVEELKAVPDAGVGFRIYL